MTDETDGTDRIKARFAWLETVALDKRTAGIPMRLAVILSAMFSEKGYAWPARPTLAAMCGSDLRNTKDALKKLVDLGYLLIEPNPKQGPNCTDRFWPIGFPDASPVWTKYREVTAQGGRTDPPYPEVDPASTRGVSGTVRGVSGPKKGGLETPRPLEDTPITRTPSSETNVSAAAFASARPSREWKGSEGEPIPAGFPDSEAMRDAADWVSFAGAQLDLGAEREAFRRYHFSVRCLLTDWHRSWEMWIDRAVQQAGQ